MAAKNETAKAYAAHTIAIMLVLLLGLVSVLAISGIVDLEKPAVSLFVGSLVGLVSGLLSAPLVFYYGVEPNIPGNGNGEKKNGNGA